MSNTKPSDPRAFADSIMLRTLRRAHDGKLRRGEAQATLALMQSFEVWSSASERSELVENGHRIIELAGELKAQTDEMRDHALDDLIARAKAVTHQAVVESIRCRRRLICGENIAPSSW
jgi:hypothetical protein